MLKRLLDGVPGHELRFFGVRLGDPAESLKNVPYDGKTEGKTYQEALHGNELDVGDISFEVQGDMVERVYLKRVCFHNLAWKTIEDVIAVLGPPDRCDQGIYNSHLSYPERSLSVFLDHDNAEVHATISRFEAQGPRHYGARDLLAHLLEAPWLLEGRTPRGCWEEAVFKRVELLAKALGLPLHQLADGSFLADDDVSSPVRNMLQEHAGPSAGNFPCDSRHAYTHLLRFRLKAQQLLDHNSGFLEASGDYVGLIRMTTVGDRLEPVLAAVEQALVLLLDPKQIQVPESTLVTQGWISDKMLSDLKYEDW